MLWTSDVVKDPWFPLVKDPSDMSSYDLSRFTPRCNDPTCEGGLSDIGVARQTHQRASLSHSGAFL